MNTCTRQTVTDSRRRAKVDKQSGNPEEPSIADFWPLMSSDERTEHILALMSEYRSMARERSMEGTGR